jgi:hypothetical protein
MPCHCENDVIYMEEAHSDAIKATLGVNAADIQRTARVAVSAGGPCPGMIFAANRPDEC